MRIIASIRESPQYEDESISAVPFLVPPMGGCIVGHVIDDFLREADVGELFLALFKTLGDEAFPLCQFFGGQFGTIVTTRFLHDCFLVLLVLIDRVYDDVQYRSIWKSVSSKDWYQMVVDLKYPVPSDNLGSVHSPV